MRRAPSSLALLLLVVTLAACAPAGPVKPPADADEPPPPPVVVRKAVAAERGAEEMQVAINLIRDRNLFQAEANFEEILRVRPDIAEAHFNLAWVRQQLGLHEKVAEPARGGLELRPTEIRAWLLLALSERELGAFGEAEASYRAALALAPDDPRIHLNLGILYDLYMMKPEKALPHYKRYQSLQKAPDSKVAGWIAVIERKVGK